MLVNCAAYRNGQKISDIAIDQISATLKQEDAFVWVAIKDPIDELDQLGEEFDLHPLAVEDAKQGHQRPKIEEYGDSLFVVLHTIERDSQGEFETGEIAIFVGKNYILSVRNRTKEGFTNVRQRCEKEPELLQNGSAFVMYAIIDSVVDRYIPVVTSLEQELETLEDHIFSQTNSVRTNVEHLYNLKRKLVELQHASAPLLDAISKLTSGRSHPLCKGMQEYFRDVADHLTRISKSIDSIREMATTAIQVNLSLISLNESEVSKKLAGYGALFAVPTGIAGIYGMNFRFMPELEWQYGYPCVVLFIIGLDIFLWWRFRKMGWL